GKIVDQVDVSLDEMYPFDAALQATPDGVTLALFDGYAGDYRVYDYDADLNGTAAETPKFSEFFGDTSFDDYFSLAYGESLLTVMSDYWDYSLIVYDDRGTMHRIEGANVDSWCDS